MTEKSANKEGEKKAEKKAEHYFTEKPTSRIELQEIWINARNTAFSLTTSSGLFSPKRVDIGTQQLMNEAIVKPGWKILDLGCGYGVVGITLKRAVPEIDVVFSDINERALKITQKNLKDMKIEGKVVKSDCFESIKDDDFDAILLNPPQTAGRDVCYKMIEGSIKHLKVGGLLEVVARHNKGGRTLSKKMEEVFGNMKSISRVGGYQVYVSEKK